ncbi:unnamed protein product [Closterium sp. Yama58-4]|nr:unnamed protein product [Closterium sp. Yama58-4]
MMLYKTPHHPYVQASSLCRNTKFRKWAHDVFHTQEKASKEFSARHDADDTVMCLRSQLDHLLVKTAAKANKASRTIRKLEEDNKAKEDLLMQNDDVIAEKDVVIAEKDAEIARLRALLEQRAAGTCPPSDVSSLSPPPDQGAPKCQSMEHAWVLWNLQGRGDKRRLRDRYGKDTCFVKHHSYDGGSKSVGGIIAQMRRVKRVMDAVEALGETTKVIQKLESILGRIGGWSTFTDDIGVVKMAGKVEPVGDDGLEAFTPTQHDQLKVARMLVETELRTKDWLKTKFPTTWDKFPALKPQKAGKASAKKRQKVANM